MSDKIDPGQPDEDKEMAKLEEPAQPELLPDPAECEGPKDSGQSTAGPSGQPLDHDPDLDDPDVADHRLMAGLSYLNILFLVPLLTARQSKFAMHHCRQGIVVFAVLALLSFVTWIQPIGIVVYLVSLLIAVVGFVQAWRGRWWKVPLLGKYAKMLKI